MSIESCWKCLRLLALSGLVAFAAVAPPSAAPFSSIPVAQANDDDEDDDEDEDEDQEAQGRVVNGQVVGIYDPKSGWAKAPNTTFDESTPKDLVALRVGQTGGVIVPVVLYNPNLIPEWGLKMGDSVSVDGEFNGGTFYGTDLEVTDRCC